MAFSAFATPALAQTSSLFPLDHFWTYTLDAPFAAPPAVDGHRVYVALQTGALVALEPGKADPVWAVELAADSALVAADNRLFVSASGMIHALDASTGSVVWRLPAGPLAVPITYRAGWLIVALADGALQAVRAADGVVIWAKSMGAPLTSAPAIDGNLLVAGFGDGRMAVMDLASGNVRWQKSLGSPASAVTLSGDRIFAGSADGFFWSIETSDGGLGWRFQLGARVIGAAAADADRVYAVALDNLVRGFSRSSGNLKWSYPLSTRPLSGPMLLDGLIVMTSGDVGAPGLIYINPITGAAAGKTPALPAVDATTRAQYPVVMSGGTSPFALLATATTSGDWQLHAYRQTFLLPAPGLITWGRRYEIRRRLDYAIGAVIWGSQVPLVPPVLLVPQVRF